MKSRTTKHIEWEQVISLVNNLKEDNNRLHLLITIQSMLGLRISDVLSLRWKDFDTTELTITEGKTRKSRRMIVNESLRNAMKEEFERKVLNKKGDLIFLNKHKSGSISISYVNRELKKAFEKYGIECEQVSTHVFRKSFSMKILQDNDFSDKAIFTISRMLNHSSIAITMKYLLLDQRESDNIYNSLTL